MKVSQQFKRLGSLVIMGVFGLVSCSKDDTSDDIPSRFSGILIKTETDAQNFEEYSYNSKGLLSQMDMTEDGIKQSITITYNTQDLPVSLFAAGEGGFDIKYHYNASKKLEWTEQTVKITGEQESRLKTTFSYTNGKLSQTNIFISGFEHPLIQGNITYLTNGNLEYTIKQFDFERQEMVHLNSFLYEFDNKKNPLEAYHDILMGVGIGVGHTYKHNIAKQTTYDSNGDIVETTTYNYRYNSDDYPVEVVEKHTIGGRLTEESSSKFFYK